MNVRCCVTCMSVNCPPTYLGCEYLLKFAVWRSFAPVSLRWVVHLWTNPQNVFFSTCQKRVETFAGKPCFSSLSSTPRHLVIWWDSLPPTLRRSLTLFKMSQSFLSNQKRICFILGGQVCYRLILFRSIFESRSRVSFCCKKLTWN